MPGVKWSILLPTGSIGMRFGAVHERPLVEVLITISLALQPGSNRQSYQTTYTLPEASTSAEGRSGLRMNEGSKKVNRSAILTVLLQLAPPLVERNEARMAIVKFCLNSMIGTTTVPLG